MKNNLKSGLKNGGTMRLDRFFSSVGQLTRSECGVAVKKGRIAVNGEVVKTASVKILPCKDEVTLDGETVVWQEYYYLMLNKPSGYISSTEDSENTVMKLLPEKYSRAGCFPCGRLDIDTVGLLLITNDGDTAHRLLSPKKHALKSYRFRCSVPIGSDEIYALENGIDLGDFVTLPAKAEMITPTEGVISVTEGKFHQIKRMLLAVGSKIEFLERISFGGLELDEKLDRGEWRELTDDEISVLKEA